MFCFDLEGDIFLEPGPALIFYDYSVILIVIFPLCPSFPTIFPVFSMVD